MTFYKISKGLLFNSRIISCSQTIRFKQAKFLQHASSFHSTPQRYSSVPFLFGTSETYSHQYSTPQPSRLQKVIDKTYKAYDNNDSFMLVSTSQGSLFTFLCRAMKVKKVLEIGTFTGYSALCFAEGIRGNGPDVKVITCESSAKNADFALQNIKEAGMEGLIEVKVGDGLETLRNLDRSTSFDLIFIDANKGGYINYYETILERNLLAENGLILADNVLFSGFVQRVPNYDPRATNEDDNYIPKTVYSRIAKQLHDFNEHVNKDPRTTNLLLPAFDGLMVVRKN